MSEAPEPAGSPSFLPAGECPVCGTPVADLLDRCPDCGYDLAGVPPRPVAYSRTAIGWTVGVFVLIYVVIVVAVALAN